MAQGVRLCCLFVPSLCSCAVNRRSRSQVASQKVKCQHTEPLAQCIKNAFPDRIPTRIQQKKRKEIERAYVARLPDARAKKEAKEQLGWKDSQPGEQRSTLWTRASTEARGGEKTYSGWGDGPTQLYSSHN